MRGDLFGRPTQNALLPSLNQGRMLVIRAEILLSRKKVLTRGPYAAAAGSGSHLIANVTNASLESRCGQDLPWARKSTGEQRGRHSAVVAVRGPPSEARSLTLLRHVESP